MTMNISEFERTKPKQTFSEFDNLIKKYGSRANNEIMDDADAKEVSMSLEIKNDLLKLKGLFKAGA